MLQYYLTLSIKIYIIVTLIHFLVAKTKHTPLKYILIVAAANIIITDVFKYQLNIKTSVSVNIYVILHFFLWLQILTPYLKKQYKPIINYTFIGITILSLSTINIHANFYNNYFVATSITYVLMFFWVCVRHLKNEDIRFFKSIQFVLIFAPVLFFLTQSILSGFKSRIFSDTDIIDGLSMYAFMNFIANTVYYSLLNYYILKSKSHA